MVEDSSLIQAFKPFFKNKFVQRIMENLVVEGFPFHPCEKSLILTNCEKNNFPFLFACRGFSRMAPIKKMRPCMFFIV